MSSKKKVEPKDCLWNSNGSKLFLDISCGPQWSALLSCCRSKTQNFIIAWQICQFGCFPRFLREQLICWWLFALPNACLDFLKKTLLAHFIGAFWWHSLELPDGFISFCSPAIISSQAIIEHVYYSPGYWHIEVLFHFFLNLCIHFLVFIKFHLKYNDRFKTF